MSVEQAILNYGYWAVLLGTVLEGEAVLLCAGIWLRQGYLDFCLVGAAALAGAVGIDQICFILGRTAGRRLKGIYPSAARRLTIIEKSIESHTDLFVFGFRFLYGLRGLSAFAIGACKVSPLRFSALNMLGAALWIGLLIAGGYWSGSLLDQVIPSLSTHLVWVAPIAILCAVTLRRTVRAYSRRTLTGT